MLVAVHFRFDVSHASAMPPMPPPPPPPPSTHVSLLPTGFFQCYFLVMDFIFSFFSFASRAQYGIRSKGYNVDHMFYILHAIWPIRILCMAYGVSAVNVYALFSIDCLLCSSMTCTFGSKYRNDNSITHSTLTDYTYS